MTDKIVVLSNCGSLEEAHRIAHELVSSHLAACVNILPGVRSIYRWQGKIEDESETTILIKTTNAHFERLRSELRRLHSYQVPEIIAIPVSQGDRDYFEWIDRETSEP